MNLKCLTSFFCKKKKINGEGKGADAFAGMNTGGNPLLLLSFGRIWSLLGVV